MILTESIKGLENTEAKDFSLLGIDGKTYSLKTFAEQKVLAIIFMCNHCPYVKAVLPRLNTLAKEFEKKGVGFVGINANDSTDYPEDSFAAMQEIEIAFPYLHDESQEVAKAYKAVCTPDIFVYDAERKLAYHGRIDDNWKDVAAVKQQDLKNALEKILAGEKIPKENQIPAMGCSIKWK
jgi:peroxiredoxin